MNSEAEKYTTKILYEISFFLLNLKTFLMKVKQIKNNYFLKNFQNHLISFVK